MRNLIAMSVAALLMAHAGDATPQSRDTPAQNLTALDVAEIEALYARSNLAIDSGAEGGLAFARTFVADGVLRRNGTTVTGQASLAQLARNKPGLRTWIGNLVIEPSVDGAVGWAYILQIELARSDDPPADRPSGVTEGGLYHDVIVKTPSGWRFKTRSYTAGHGLPSDKP